MHSTVESIVAGIDKSTYEQVARAVIGDESAELVGEPQWSEIDASHGDLRTLAILRLQGWVTVGDSQIPWSSVQKVIDTTADGGPGNRGNWVDPSREEAIYERGLFRNDGLHFRPVDCYLVTEPQPGFKILWLEDLTEAEGTPFSVSQLHQILQDLGEFNGHHATQAKNYRLPLATNSYLLRWRGRDYGQAIDRVSELADRHEIQRVFRTTTLETARELYLALDKLSGQSPQLRHSVSFGDCNIGNLFRFKGQTVAIDWATVTNDPTGVDAGCLIGSAIQWSRDPSSILEAETDLFSTYLAGLRSGGWGGDEEDIRRAFFGQFGTYLLGAGIWPRMLEDTEFASYWGDWVEKRMQASMEEILGMKAEIVDRYPLYLVEVRQLID